MSGFCCDCVDEVVMLSTWVTVVLGWSTFSLVSWVSRSANGLFVLITVAFELRILFLAVSKASSSAWSKNSVFHPRPWHRRFSSSYTILNLRVCCLVVFDLGMVPVIWPCCCLVSPCV